MLKALLVIAALYYIYQAKRPTTIGNYPSSQGTISSDSHSGDTVGGNPGLAQNTAVIPIRQPGQITAQGQVNMGSPSWRYYDSTEYVYETPVTPDYSGYPSNAFRYNGDNYGARQ